MKDTNLLKFFAILLIVNSHCDYFYPIRSIGTGGAIGNSVFFMLAAYGLYLSELKNQRPFVEWYSRRVARIFPSTWVVLLILYFPIEILSQRLFKSDFLAICNNFFYPPFWFIQALMMMYFFMFVLIKNYNNKKMFLFSAGTLAVYAVTYLKFIDITKFSIEELPIKVYFYFAVCLLGVWIARNDRRIRHEGLKDYLGFAACVIIMYFHKHLMVKNLFPEFQFIQQLVLFPMIFFSLKIVRNENVLARISRMPRVSRSINYIADNTLEIYMVHMTTAPVVLSAKLKWPLNFILFVGSICVFVPIVSFLSKKLFSAKQKAKVPDTKREEATLSTKVEIPSVLPVESLK